MAKPAPIKRRDFLNTYVEPYIKDIGNPNVDLPQQNLPGTPEFNRGFELSLKGDTDPIPSIGLLDIDETIKFYFENRIKPFVYQNNTRINVPVIYGDPERWKAVQADGFYRDVNGKIQVPLIMYKRDTIEQNRDLGNKLDGNSAHNIMMLKKKFSRRNVYDNFYLLKNQKPIEEWILAIIPDYVTLTYSCIIFTDYIEQMNKLVEAINFASNSYWGDPERFQFKARIDSFTTQTLLESGDDRAVKSTFNILMNGYIIPDSINAELAKTANKIHNFTKVIFSPELVKKF